MALLEGSPLVMPGPFSLPLVASSRVWILKSPLSLSVPWQCTQAASRMGLTF